jgi:hypothetical protein
MASIGKITEIAEQAKKELAGVKKEESNAPKHTVIINGKNYKIKPIPWEEGVEMWEDIVKRCLPSVGSGLDRLQHDELSGSPTTFTEMMINLSQNLSGTTLLTYSKALADGATVDGEPMDLNTEFTGNYGAWMKWFTFAMKENFSSFFDQGWVMGMIDKLTAMLTPVQESV